MKERKYDLYGDVKCRMYLEKNEDDDHIIYCQQLKDKWLTVANNTRYECKQILKDLLSQENYLQLNQEDIQQSIIIWQPCCNQVTEWECTRGIKKKDPKKKIPAHQHIAYERTLTQQIEGDTYNFKGRKILKHNEQWSISLEKIRQYINQFIQDNLEGI
ncbi:uncharacterized protein OCT59_021549 [Rhizophagus irregularis]|uniref:uncharacterized protein n=1 Tax=Rhizophagus irregularis TaxID=588596 RepID=UPI0019E279E3|nr:hypothetical protein OCT59_021549 [Rhizophagus irregularis]GBC16044.2 hypothetical protein RIR_jg42231.t1 [Rhizophagus irregularis DAOM 181602=DAOM 197198]